MSAQRSPEPGDGVRWGLVVAVTAVGLVVTGSPYVLTSLVDRSFGTWQSLVSGTMTSIGTTLLLVAAVWLLERKFTARITSAVQETVRATVAEETSELVASQRDFSLRLDELQERLDARVKEGRGLEDAVLDRLGTGVSRETVAAALKQANDLGALWLHRLVVPVGSGSEELPRFEIRYGELEAPWSAEDLFNLDDDGSQVTITHVGVRAGSGGLAKIIWRSGAPADEVLAELKQSMVRHGRAELAEMVDATLFRNLELALRCAVSGRRRDEGSWVSGAMYEWLSESWAVTSAGLEGREHSGLSAGAFPRHMSGRAGVVSNHEALTWEEPAAPDGVDERWWSFMIRRARSVHRMGAGF